MNSQKRFLYFIFFVSGITALIYQVAWQRLLTVYFGVDYLATTLIVSVFMLGLGLGALCGGQFIDRVEQRLRKYALLECFIGLFGFVSLPFLDFLGRIGAGSGVAITFILIFLFLFVPTFFMGMTLPFLVRIFQDFYPNILNTLSSLYFVNTLGAAFGSLITAYILFSSLGIAGSIYIAATVNFILAVLILALSKFKVKKELVSNSRELSSSLRLSFYTAAFLVFVTGFIALGYEIVWFRLLQIMTKSSPYSFASTLFVYLLGIALGSYFMKRFIKKYPKHYNASLFFMFQFLIGITVLLSILLFFYATKYTSFSYLAKTSFHILQHPAFSLDPIGYNTHYTSPLIALFVLFYQNTDVFFWGLFFVFIPTLFMGASFPLIASLLDNKNKNTGALIGNIYFFAILGNVAGVLVTGFILLPFIKTTGTLLTLSIIGASFILLINSKRRMYAMQALKYVLFGILILLSFLCFPTNDEFYTLLHFQKNVTTSYIEEGSDAVIATFKMEDGTLSNFIGGLGHGARPGYTPIAIALEQLSRSKEGDLDILIIGFGTGPTVETALMLDNLHSLTVVEISPSLIRNLLKFKETKEIIENPRVHLIIDDGRKFLLETNETYDIILMDPLRQTTSYSNNIYSKEFFELVKTHLNPEGIYGFGNGGQGYGVQQCVLPKTVNTVFTHMDVFDYFVIASDSPLVKNQEIIDDILETFDPLKKERVLAKENPLRFTEEDFPADNTFKITTDYTPWLEFRIGFMFEEDKANEKCALLFSS